MNYELEVRIKADSNSEYIALLHEDGEVVFGPGQWPTLRQAIDHMVTFCRDSSSSPTPGAPAGAIEPSAMSRDSRAMLLNVIWHHQGASSTVGQPLRAMLGIGQHDRLNDEQLAEAKRIDGLLSAAQAETDNAHPTYVIYTRPGMAPAAPQLAAQQEGMRDAYEGAREDLAIWKRRALVAERDLRAERETTSRLAAELNAANGPTHLGEPAAPRLDDALADGEADFNAFSRAMVNAGYCEPERSCFSSELFLHERDQDRYVGWCLARGNPSVVPWLAAPQNDDGAQHRSKWWLESSEDARSITAHSPRGDTLTLQIATIQPSAWEMIVEMVAGFNAQATQTQNESQGWDIDAAVEKAWGRFQAAMDNDEPLPPPSIHAAAHYGTWLVREAHRHDESKAGAFRNAARMLAVLEAETRRLHTELIAALAQNAAAAPQGEPGDTERLDWLTAQDNCVVDESEDGFWYY